MTSTPNPDFRRAVPGDSPALGELTERSSRHWNYPPGFFDWALGAAEVPSEYIAENPVFVLEEKGRLVGYYGFTKEGDELMLDKLFVDLDRIGTGAGRRWWNHALETARDQGYREFIIGSDPNAAPFYEAMGATWYAAKPTPNPEWTVQMFRYSFTVDEDLPM